MRISNSFHIEDQAIYDAGRKSLSDCKESDRCDPVAIEWTTAQDRALETWSRSAASHLEGLFELGWEPNNKLSVGVLDATLES